MRSGMMALIFSHKINYLAPMAIPKKLRRKIRYQLIYLLVRGLIIISNIITRKAWLKLCGVLGILAFHFASKTRALTFSHLAMAFPEKSQSEIRTLTKRNFKMLGKNAGEILRSSRAEKLSDLEKFVVTSGIEHFEKANAKGKGVIFLGSHLGAFDLQVTNMAMRGYSTNVIGTPLKDERLNELLWKHRNKYGAVAITRGKETFRMLKILKSGGSVALLIDQDTKVKSRFVDFFGMPASTPVGATLLALKTGAAVVPSYIYLGDDGLQHMNIMPEIPMVITGDEEIDLVHNTQILTNFIEHAIRQHPDQWVWMHERWKTKKGEEIL
jgi:KDO2-lipid IV(A) lauroyltransferase